MSIENTGPDSGTDHDYGRMLFSSLALTVSLIFAHSSLAESLSETGAPTAELELWTVLAGEGDADAQYNLGLMHIGGASAEEPVYERAAYWFEQAARQGHSGAQYRLGSLYINGRGVARDPDKAVHWWRQAAENNHMLAQRNLAHAYITGVGVGRDEAQAMHWFALAAKAGDWYSIEMLRNAAAPPSAPPDPGLLGELHRPVDIDVGDRSEGHDQPGSMAAGERVQQTAVKEHPAMVTAGDTQVATSDARAATSDDAQAAPSDDVSATEGDNARVAVVRSEPTASVAASGDGPTAAENDRWLFAKPKTGYTIQLISSRQRELVERFARKDTLRKYGRIFETSIKGEPWWYLIYGAYSKRERAVAAVKSLGVSPKQVWIRNFAVLQKNRCRRLSTAPEPLSEELKTACTTWFEDERAGSDDKR